MKNNGFIFLFFILNSLFVYSQDSTKLAISGFVDVYYSYDFDKPTNHQRPFFIYNHKRHNEVNVNLAYMKANYANSKVRANLALMSGTYAQYNMTAEPGLLQYIYEANVGVSLSNKHNIWVDAGIMPSHIGFESAVSQDCWTLSRSMLAENSPYFESGVKLTSTNKKETAFISLFVLNGWQRIRRIDGMNNPSYGLQINYKPTSKLTLNYSNFVGSDKPDSLDAWRTYHNFYGILEMNAKFGMIIGFDIGTDKAKFNQYYAWYSPVLIFKYKLSVKSTMALRGEYYDDRDQVLLVTSTINGFQTTGISLNYDLAITKNVLFRIEGKGYFSKDKIFKLGTEYNNYSLLTSLSIKF